MRDIAKSSRTRPAALALLLALAAGAATSVAEVRPSDAVPGHPGLTYLELVKRALPTLAPNPDDGGAIEGHLPTPAPRHLGGKVFEGESPDPVTLGWLQDQRVLSGGHRRMVILADLGPDPDRVQSQTLLLLFTDEPRPRLLDVADVGVDRDTEFDEQQPKLSLGPGDDALVTISEHGEADISYDGRLVVFAPHDRLQRIAGVFVLNERACAWRQVETLRLTTKPDPGRRYADVDIAVRHKIERTGEQGCGDPAPKAVARTYQARYRWDDRLARFATTSSALKRLAKLNSTAF